LGIAQLTILPSLQQGVFPDAVHLDELNMLLSHR